jgi:anti-sigma regulatory factor (Ser/Thr protein kinase)
VKGVEESFPAAYLKLNATTATVGFGRLLVKEALSFWGLDEMAADAELIMSELLTNAVIHSAAIEAGGGGLGGLALVAPQVRIEGSSLFVEVWDGTSKMPGQRASDDEDEGGRGLLLVDKLSEQWGASPGALGGKVVYGTLPLKAPTPVSLTGCVVPLSRCLWKEHVDGTQGQHAMADQAMFARIMNPLTML